MPLEASEWGRITLLSILFGKRQGCGKSWCPKPRSWGAFGESWETKFMPHIKVLSVWSKGTFQHFVWITVVWSPFIGTKPGHKPRSFGNQLFPQPWRFPKSIDSKVIRPHSEGSSGISKKVWKIHTSELFEANTLKKCYFWRNFVIFRAPCRYPIKCCDLTLLGGCWDCLKLSLCESARSWGAFGESWETKFMPHYPPIWGVSKYVLMRHTPAPLEYFKCSTGVWFLFFLKAYILSFISCTWFMVIAPVVSALEAHFKKTTLIYHLPCIRL